MFDIDTKCSGRGGLFVTQQQHHRNVTTFKDININCSFFKEVYVGTVYQRYMSWISTVILTTIDRCARVERTTSAIYISCVLLVMPRKLEMCYFKEPSVSTGTELILFQFALGQHRHGVDCC